jgi:hypothetical protein
MRVVPCPPGAKGADMASVLTTAHAMGLRNAGLDYVVRYLGGLSPAELAAILSAGLGCQLVTYSRAPGWHPTQTMGDADGLVDVGRLERDGIPKGMLAWIDLEGASGGSADVAAWLDARSKIIVDAGYIAGVYAGDSCILDGPELYARPYVTRYWRAFNIGIPEPQCGWCQLQSEPNTMLAGVLVDHDVAQADNEGRVPLMLSA